MIAMTGPMSSTQRRRNNLPVGPKGERRSADVIANAVKVMWIATGEELENCGDAPAKNHAAAGTIAICARAGKPSQERTSLTLQKGENFGGGSETRGRGAFDRRRAFTVLARKRNAS